MYPISEVDAKIVVKKSAASAGVRRKPLFLGHKQTFQSSKTSYSGVNIGNKKKRSHPQVFDFATLFL